MTDIIGKELSEAQNHLEKHGKIMRVIEQDSKPFLGTTDYWANRVNVKVSDGKVSAIAYVG